MMYLNTIMTTMMASATAFLVRNPIIAPKTVLETLNEIKSVISNYVQPIGIIALILVGLAYMWAGKKGADGAKETLKNVFIGIFIAVGAATLYNIIAGFATNLSGL